MYTNMSIAKDISFETEIAYMRLNCKCFNSVKEIAAESCLVSFSQLSLEVAQLRF